MDQIYILFWLQYLHNFHSLGAILHRLQEPWKVERNHFVKLLMNQSVNQNSWWALKTHSPSSRPGSSVTARAGRRMRGNRRKTRWKKPSLRCWAECRLGNCPQMAAPSPTPRACARVQVSSRYCNYYKHYTCPIFAKLCQDLNILF